MKIFLLFVTATILHCPAFSQLNKGQWIVGGSASYSSNKVESDFSMGGATTTFKELEMSPGVGYFFIERLASGMRLAIQGSRVNQTADNQIMPGFIYEAESFSKTSAIGFTPFARYYFLPTTKKINLFADGSFTYSFNRSKTRMYEYSQTGTNPPVISESTSNTKFETKNFTLAAGPAFFLNPKVALELSIGYSFGSYSDTESNTQTVLLGAGFNIHLGK